MMNAEDLLPPGLASGSLLRADATPFISTAAKEGAAEQAMFLPWLGPSGAATAATASGGLPGLTQFDPCDLLRPLQEEAAGVVLETLPSPMRVVTDSSELEPTVGSKALALEQLLGSAPLRVARAEAENLWSEATTPLSGSAEASEELLPAKVHSEQLFGQQAPWWPSTCPFPVAVPGKLFSGPCLAPGSWSAGGARSSRSWAASGAGTAKAPRKRHDVEGGEGECMASVMQKLNWWDPAQVVLVRRIMRLGYSSPALLREHYSYYGRVEVVLVVNSSTKDNNSVPNAPNANAAPVRCRPSGLGFVVMGNALEAESALAAGAEQIVGGVAIRVTRFERRSGQDGSVDRWDERVPVSVPVG